MLPLTPSAHFNLRVSPTFFKDTVGAHLWVKPATVKGAARSEPGGERPSQATKSGTRELAK
jgi:hypothetical protein